MTTDALFIFEDDDPSCDPGWTLRADPSLSIQDATAYGGGYCLNEVEEEPEWCMWHHHTYRRLYEAQHAAICIAAWKAGTF